LTGTGQQKFSDPGYLYKMPVKPFTATGATDEKSWLYTDTLCPVFADYPGQWTAGTIVMGGTGEGVSPSPVRIAYGKPCTGAN